MNRRALSSLLVSLSLLAGATTGVSSALGQVGTGVSYQGQLKNSGQSVNTPSDFRFTLWDAATAGNQVGTTDTKIGVSVSQGLFNTTFDCGVNPYTADAARWLQVEVRNPSNTGGFVLLGARQRLTGVPFSEATRGLTVDAFGRLTLNPTGPGSQNDQSLTVYAANPGMLEALGTTKNGLLSRMEFYVDETTAGNPGGGRIRMQSPNVGYGSLNLNDALTVNAGPSGGNVGIGTTTPERALHLKGNSVGMFLQDTGDADGPNARWALDTRAFGVNGIALVRYDGPSANAQKSLFLANNGNLGVGLGAPYNKIDVQVGGTIGNSTILGTQTNDPANRGTKVQFGYRTSETGCGPNDFNGMRVEVDPGTNGCGNSIDLSFFTGECNTSCPREVMRINGSGNVGIGTSAPRTRLEIKSDGFGLFHSSADGTSDIATYADSSGGWIGTYSNKPLLFYTGNSYQQMTLQTNGNVGIGTSSPSQLLDVAGNVRCVNLIQTSSREFKQDITPLTGALESIMKLNPVTYAWNNQAPEQARGKHDIGFIADEMNEVLPDIVAKDENGKPVGIDYGKVTPVAVEAIKQLKTENDKIKADNAELKARLDRLEKLISSQVGAK